MSSIIPRLLSDVPVALTVQFALNTREKYADCPQTISRWTLNSWSAVHMVRSEKSDEIKNLCTR